MVPDASCPCCAKIEWEKEGDAELAGEEIRVWQKIRTCLEVVTETVMGECWKVTGKVHNRMDSVSMLEDIRCKGGDDMDTVRLTEDAALEDARVAVLR